MNLATIIVLLIVGAGAYWSIATLHRTGGRRCDGCCGGCSDSHCTVHHDHAKSTACKDSCPHCHSEKQSS